MVSSSLIRRLSGKRLIQWAGVCDEVQSIGKLIYKIPVIVSSKTKMSSAAHNNINMGFINTVFRIQATSLTLLNFVVYKCSILKCTVLLKTLFKETYTCIPYGGVCVCGCTSLDQAVLQYILLRLGAVSMCAVCKHDYIIHVLRVCVCVQMTTESGSMTSSKS